MFVNLDDIDSKMIVEGFLAKFVHSEKMTVAHWNIRAGAKLPKHDHVHEQIAIVIAGEFELTIEGNRQKCRPGSVAVIPANASHEGQAITDCVIIDVFSPPREDYKEKK